MMNKAIYEINKHGDAIPKNTQDFNVEECQLSRKSEMTQQF